MSDPAHVIRPPNALRMKVGGGFGINADAVARAEEALKAMAAQFDQWLKDEIVKIDAAQAQIRERGYTPETAEALYLRAHDLKGLGTTYEYPIVTRIAGSLCKLLDDPQQRMAAPLALVDAHVDGIRAVVRDEIKTDDHPVGRTLVDTLEARVSEHRAG